MKPRFRAWDSVEKKFVEHFFITDNSLICNMEKPTSDRKLPIPIEKSELILMQSTGLKDKNGKEIFEGDVLTSQNYPAKGVVEFRTDSGMWVNCLKEYGHFEYLGNVASSRKIIGNIYENPELLEDKE